MAAKARLSMSFFMGLFLRRRFFGFFGVDAVADVSEPDFLSLIVAAADVLPVPLL